MWWKCWFLRWAATEGLYRVMSGCDPQAEDLWLEIMMVIELDRKSAMDLLLLAQSGVIGRASANKIMWTLMTDWALDRAHPNLSRRVTMAVRSARERFDQPRSGYTSDGYQWTWDTLQTAPHDLRYWSPTSVPQPNFGYWRVQVAFDGRPHRASTVLEEVSRPSCSSSWRSSRRCSRRQPNPRRSRVEARAGDPSGPSGCRGNGSGGRPSGGHRCGHGGSGGASGSSGGPSCPSSGGPSCRPSGSRCIAGPAGAAGPHGRRSATTGSGPRGDSHVFLRGPRDPRRGPESQETTSCPSEGEGKRGS